MSEEGNQVEKIEQNRICRKGAIQCFVDIEKDFKENIKFNREPVKIPQNCVSRI